MKFSFAILVAASVLSLALVSQAAPRVYERQADNGGATTGAAQTGQNSGVVDGVSNLFFVEGGIPGNECITFRNNGEMVQAACVAAAADRQMKPGKITLPGGQGEVSMLEIQRTFQGQEGVQFCVANNGTHFRAEPCAKAGITLVTFDGDNMVDDNNCVRNENIANDAEIKIVARGGNDANCVTMSVRPTA